MKVFIQHNPQNIPYGGGNQYVLFLIEYLRKYNHEVTFVLDENIDILLVINPYSGPMRLYDINDIINYRNKNIKSKIFLRVNENDARKKTNHMDETLLYAIHHSDHVIYISDWLRQYFIKKGAIHKNEPVTIDMACDENIFYPKDNKIFSFGEDKKIRIITHHNSENWMKGFDIYQQIDDWLSDEKVRNKYEFYYMGDLNAKFEKRFTYHIPKNSIDTCSKYLRECDIYVTATRFEPGGNHHVEAARCGLPILYHKDGGGVVEMCSKWGLGFSNFTEFVEQLELMVENFNDYREKIDYDHLSSKRCCKEYVDYFQSCLDQ